jgi:REP element-mobilizing transposase RayT
VETDADREQFLQILGQVVERYGWLCHGYCLMDNHYHVIIETPNANLSKGMRQLNGLYTQRYNYLHGRVGHVFQGRYKAILVDKDSYLLELSRYVVLNPVRANMVRAAGDWRWSSYRAMVGRVSVPSFLTTDWLLGQFGKHRSTAQQRYIEFVRAGKDQPSLWQGLRQQIYLGSEDFVEKQLHRFKKKGKNETLKEIPRQHREMQAKPLEYYARKYRDRRQAMVEAYRTGWYSQRVIAEYYGVHYSTVSRAIRDAER